MSWEFGAFRIVLILYLIFLSVFLQASFCQAQVPRITNSSQLRDLAGGINITDDLKEQLIRCLGAVGNSLPSFQDCSTSQVPVPAPLLGAVNSTSKVADTVSKAVPAAVPKPVKNVLSVVEDTKDKITNPVKETVTNLQTDISDAPKNIDDTIAQLKGSEKEAQDLLTFRDYIQYTKQLQQNPNDPLQDLSEYYREKKANESSIYQSTDEAEANKEQLKKHFRSTDLTELRKQAANINILNPEVILIGIAEALINT